MLGLGGVEWGRWRDSAKKKIKNKLMDMGNSVVIAKEKGGREGGRGYRGDK